MRVEGPGRPLPGGGQTRAAASGASGFRLAEAASADAGRTAAPIRAAPSLDAVIALQAAVEDGPGERRRREIRRGRGQLDALDGLKLALIDGGADPRALAALAGSLAKRGERTGDGALDDTLAAIDLRARVELAKRGL